MPDTYSSQYREMVLIQVRAGRSVYDLADGLEASAATIFRWKRQDQIDAGTAVGLSSQDSAELRVANMRIAELEKELATVKRASELFAQGRVVRPKELFPIVEQLGVEGHGLKGTVALTDRVRVVACAGDPPSLYCFCFVRWISVPAGRDLVGRPVVPPLRPVVPRCRRASRGTRHRR
jgi:transposase